LEPIVLDSAIVLAWVLRERDADAAMEILDQVFASGGVVPSLWRYEVGNGILSAVRQRRVKAGQIEKVVANLAEIPVEVDRRGEDLAWTRILALAQRHALTAYDAAYLELATRRGLMMATLDRALAKAAASEGILTLPT
jgi:predicted nucleic acid-binding protein